MLQRGTPRNGRCFYEMKTSASISRKVPHKYTCNLTCNWRILHGNEPSIKMILLVCSLMSPSEWILDLGFYRDW